MRAALEKLAERLPAALVNRLREQWNDLARLDEPIVYIEKSFPAWLRQDRTAKVISAIAGVGLLTANAAVATTMGRARTFWFGREFAAWIGLIPGQTGSGAECGYWA